MENAAKRPKILVAPLDWGLGHATRCIPIVRHLRRLGAEVYLAADGPQATLLANEFPDANILPINGYGIKYSKRRLFLHLVRQLPAISRAITYEHKWLRRQMDRFSFDAVISDNRYGLSSKECQSVIISHQLQLAMPQKLGWAGPIIQAQLYKYINRFDECWVPDNEQPINSLSGELGHPGKRPAITTRYIGWLTRFEKPDQPSSTMYKALVLLSGPEPQRTLLETSILNQGSSMPSNVMMVRGLPGTSALPQTSSPFQIVNHLDAKDLQQAMEASEFVISRGGYSTLMDAFTLGKKCIFIPTPGQTEQEYLCRRLMDSGTALYYRQEEFNLAKAMEDAVSFPFSNPFSNDASPLSQFLQQWLQQL